MIEENKRSATASVVQFLRSPAAILVVLAAATVLRVWRLTEWSLWEDEETTIFFSQNPDSPFPRFSPIFFRALQGLYEITGVSVAAGRALAGGAGILSVWLVYAGVKRLISRPIALVAAFLLAINLGHLFWSQSIRYFTLQLVFQLLSMCWFLDGMERGSYRSLALANIAFALALLTHFSALLLMPVFVAYLFFAIVGRQSGGAYHLRGYLVFGIPFLCILGLFAFQVGEAKRFLSVMPLPSARDPVHLLVTALAYFGVPVVGLGLVAPLVAVGVARRIVVFFSIASVLPILELMAIGKLDLADVTWYYALFALASFTVTAAITLVSLHLRGYRKTALAGLGAACIYSGLLLVFYFTVMHGDRPRWKEAARYVAREAGVREGAEDNPEVYANVPGVVAFYLGVDPGETMGTSLVQWVPRHPPRRLPKVDQWYIIEGERASPKYRSWLQRQCILEATFASRTGPKDRTVRVYHYHPSAKRQGF